MNLGVPSMEPRGRYRQRPLIVHLGEFLLGYGILSNALRLLDLFGRGESIMDVYKFLPKIVDFIGSGWFSSVTMLLGFLVLWRFARASERVTGNVLIHPYTKQPLVKPIYPAFKRACVASAIALPLALGIWCWYKIPLKSYFIAEVLILPKYPPPTAPIGWELIGRRSEPVQASPQSDISRMTTAESLAMIASVRGALGHHSSVRFVISAPPDNLGMQREFAAIISEACSHASPQINCPVDPVGDGVTPRPKKDQQGLVFQTQETIAANQGLLIDDLPAALSRWFIVHKNSEVPPEYVLDPRNPKMDTVFIQIGYGSPWKDRDQRLHEGITQSDIDKLEGWDVPLKERLSRAATKMTNLSRPRGPSGPKRPGNPAQMKSAYQNIRAEVLMALRDARQKKHLDTGNLETVAQDPQTEEDFAAIKNKLVLLSADPSLNEN